uniref:Uncharacterized protein n=1 Tax=Cannabis sativa TaxID=3483 RepID=A0A803Q895_CANSA
MEDVGFLTSSLQPGGVREEGTTIVEDLREDVENMFDSIDDDQNPKDREDEDDDNGYVKDGLCCIGIVEDSGIHVRFFHMRDLLNSEKLHVKEEELQPKSSQFSCTGQPLQRIPPMTSVFALATPSRSQFLARLLNRAMLAGTTTLVVTAGTRGGRRVLTLPSTLACKARIFSCKAVYWAVVNWIISLDTKAGVIGGKCPMVAAGVEVSSARLAVFGNRFRGVTVVHPTPLFIVSTGFAPLPRSGTIIVPTLKELVLLFLFV